MTCKEIIENAPIGATHYNENSVLLVYYKIDNGKYYFYSTKSDFWYESKFLVGDETIKPINFEVKIEALREEFESMCYNREWNIARYPDRYEDVAGLYVDDFVSGAWWMFKEMKI